MRNTIKFIIEIASMYFSCAQISLVEGCTVVEPKLHAHPPVLYVIYTTTLHQYIYCCHTPTQSSVAGVVMQHTYYVVLDLVPIYTLRIN